MSAIKNILKLLLIFEDDKNVYTSIDLAEEIGVSTRQIRTYIKELRDFGYLIESDATRGGGYRSSGQYFDIPLKITMEELTELGRTVDYLEKNRVFEGYLILQNLYFKIRKYRKVNIDQKNQFDYRLQYQQIHEVREKKTLRDISAAIEENKKVEINYFSAKGKKSSKRIIHPYKIQFYQGANYVHAYCEKAKDYRVFKLLRIYDSEVLADKFYRSSKLEKKLDNQNFGIYTEAPKRVHLEFNYPYNEFAKEIIIGENQMIEIIDENTTLIKATICNETELIGWVMSFGKDVRVLAPDELIDNIVQQAKSIQSIYLSRK